MRQLHPIPASFCGLLTIVIATTMLAGCSLSSTAPASVTESNLGAIRGNIHGGQQPVVNAHIYLFAAGNTGNGGPGIATSTSNASTSLLIPQITGHSDSIGAYVLSGSDGSFTITGDYSCTAGQQVYIYALGGNPGSGHNSAAGFLAILGACPDTNTFAVATPFVFINEVSTVAAAYAFAGFASDATHVSSSGSALAQQGIANAFAAASNLADLASGTALLTTPHGNGLVPQKRINTLANALASCINAADNKPGQCPTLLSNALSSGPTVTIPNDTATAAINIAHNPTNAVSTIIGLSSGIGAPFLPSLSNNPDDPSYPNDFTLSIGYSGVGLAAPSGIAIDSRGNVWVPNYGSVSKFSSLGVPVSGSPFTTNFGTQPGIAIDGSDNAWIANVNCECVFKLSESGVNAVGSPYKSGGLNAPSYIAIDASGNVWIANQTANSIAELSDIGLPVSGSPYSTGVNLPGPIAFDGSNNAWVTDSDRDIVSKLSPSGTNIPGSPYTSNGLSFPFAIAIDSFGNAWVANALGNSVSKFSNLGVKVAGSPYSGGGLNQPNAIALDGSGNAWVVGGGTTVTEFSNAGDILSGTTGFIGTGLSGATQIAVDGSGNVWITDISNNEVTEFIGSATPVVTPLVTGVVNKTIASRP